MYIRDLCKVLNGCLVEIDTVNFHTIWQGDQRSIPNEFYDFEIVGLTINDGYILISVDVGI